MCKGKIMATNLALDDSLLNLALQVGGFKTKKDTVNAALQEFIERHKQIEIIELFGKFPCDKDYNYKEGRR
jgi:Arc/MetJ family transcription regulator